MGLAGAVVGLATNYITARTKRKQELKNLKEKKKLAKRQYERSLGSSPEEVYGAKKLKDAASGGAIDVQDTTAQVTQPLYQQGENIEAQAQGNITQQGLEGSIIAQETSQKIGSEVRAEIANQARNIAIQNEQTKLDAKKTLQDNVMKRADLLRSLAFKRQDELTGFESEKRGIEQGFTSNILGSTLSTLTGQIKSSEFDSKFKPIKSAAGWLSKKFGKEEIQ